MSVPKSNEGSLKKCLVQVYRNMYRVNTVRGEKRERMNGRSIIFIKNNNNNNTANMHAQKSDFHCHLG